MYDYHMGILDSSIYYLWLMVFEVFWLLALSILLYVFFLLSILHCCFLEKLFYLFRKYSLYWKDKQGISFKSKTREKIPKRDEMMCP